jgi:hypothetical protein
MSSDLPATDEQTPAAQTRYRALSPAAVVSLALGVLSFLTMFWWPLAIIPIAGMVVGWLALRQIQAAPEEWTGLKFAQWGIGVSLALWIAGYVWYFGLLPASVRSAVGMSDIPFGYELVSYDTLQPTNPAEFVPESATLMDDKKVYIKGYMKPSRRQTGIKDFIMCPSSGQCPFCNPDPKPTEMIRVMMQGGATTAFTNRQIGIAGRLHVDPTDPGGVPYSLDADYVR